MIEPFGASFVGTRTGLIALDIALKATALIGLTFGIHAILGRRRALIRSALWNACLLGLLLIPAADLALPRLIVTVPTERIVPHLAAPIHQAQSPAGSSPESGPSPMPTPIMPEAFDPAERPASAPVPGPPARTWAMPGGIDLAFGVYLLGAALLAIRFGIACVGVARLKRGSSPVEDASWSGPMERRRIELGIRRGVALLASDGVSVPVVVGWLRPAVIIPRRLSAAASPALIDAVLLHELGHVRRGDFGWNLVRKLAQLVYWPHPLVWPIGPIIERVREQACDDLCVHNLGGPAAYGDSLIEVAANLVRRPESALGLAMARPTNLGLRLAWIDRTRGASRCLLRWPGRVSLAVAVSVAASLLGSIEFARAAARAAVVPAENREAELLQDLPDAIEVTVRAKDGGKPLEGASVRASIDLEETGLKADREGRVLIDLSKRRYRDSLSFDVWAEGYVQQRYFFSQTDPRYPKIPAQIAIELLPGEQTLGGTVVDEQGRPIAGVAVKIWGYLGQKKQKEELAYMVDATTDDRGQWRCRCFRSMTFANLYLTHPDYLADDTMHARRHGQPRPTPSAAPDPEEKPLAALRDFSDVQILKRGIEVAGQVIDEQGRPIADAEVGWIEADQHDLFHQDLPLTKTDGEGRFRFPQARPGRLVLQVKAKGHAPGLKTVEAKDGPVRVDIKLGSPRTLEGRVVDSKGEPIADAFLVIDTWRTYRSLGVYLKSAADGTFRWEEAPPDTVLVNASHPGFTSVTQQRVSPDGKALFTLRRALSISGIVRDAKTRKGIDAPTVEIGTPDPKTGAFAWAENNGIFASQGTLQATVDVERTPEFRLRIKARGYEPFESRTFRVGEPPSELDVALKPTDKPDGIKLSGVVRGPDGAPLAGAEVKITYPLGDGRDRLPSVQIQDGKFQADERAATAKTDAEGRFDLTRETDPVGQYFAVVVVHPQFYAEVGRAAFEADPTIVARPWGRVEGVARVGNKPASGVIIRSFSDRLGNRDVPYVFDRSEVKADARGTFAIERVVPGDVRVVMVFGEGANARGSTYGSLLDVRPGETARAELGGRGRPMIARIAPPPGSDPNGDYVANSQVEIASDRPNIPYPREVLAKRDGSMVEWGKKWWASAEGHEYRRNFFQFSQARLQPDGTIRVDDVPPGDYRLNLTYTGDPLRGITSAPERITFATRQFTIPAIAGDRGEEPYDLGTLHPRPRQALKVGEAAPRFDVETLDGGRVKIEDFRGKYLLLQFWATWCGPCVAEIPELKTFQERFGKDERFAILGLSLDDEKDAPRKFVAGNGVGWKQGFLGEWSDGGVADAYHVQAIPAMFLIGPDGTVKAIGTSGNAIEAAISEALR